MKIYPTEIPGLMIMENELHTDNRGAFSRLFCNESLKEHLGSSQIVQINHSITYTAGTVRGLHYQKPPHAEIKMVRCQKGKVWDIAVDLRSGSPTFLKWHAEELSSDNRRMMIIPEGCAHGFQTLEENSELLYLHTAPYTPSAEAGIQANDPLLAISWPLPIQDLSDRDRSHPLLTASFTGLTV